LRVIISPAKKMTADEDTLPFEDLPCFLDEARTLLHTLQGMDYPALRALWRCNDAIATLNHQRMQGACLHRNLTPALLSYRGIQYQYMAPGALEDRQFDYLRGRLYILSGLYGLLSPFDGVVPYRLEMQTALSFGGFRNLYDFWNVKLAQKLTGETDFILNLASREYSRAITPHLPDTFPFVTCVFGEQKDGRVIEKGTLCKMARGEMVRWLAEEAITDPRNIRAFDRLGYTYCKDLSTTRQFVFIKS
jgi:cytoplasmic iron level regulating protein YaaA (DUF328/UPF0246 family)